MKIGPKSRKELREYISEDTNRNEKFSFKVFLSRYFIEIGFKYVFWLRLTRYYFLKGKKALLPFLFCRMILKHYGNKYSFDISYRAQIGKGLYIAHNGYIVVASSTIMGDNCRFRPGVVIGGKITEENKGTIIGNNVEFGVGSKIIGVEKIGNNVIIGANSVVTKNIQDNVIVAGIPAKIVRNIK